MTSALFPSRCGFLALSGVVLLFVSCVKNNSKSTSLTATASDKIVIASITPSTGPAGTVDTITGSGFDRISTDSLFLNGKQLVVSSKTSTQIIFAIPKLAGSGNIMIGLGGQTAIGPAFHYDSGWSVSTVAGSGQAMFADGKGTAASFYDPRGIVMDKQNNLFIGDDDCIRKITPDGTVTTFAGTGTTEGWADGTGAAAAFGDMLWGLALDSSGNLIVADGEEWRIRKITPGAVVTTIAGNMTPGNMDGPGTTALFSDPTAVAVNAQGDILVVDRGNQNIRMIDPQYNVTTLAGANAGFNQPLSGALDSSGNLYVGDDYFLVRKVTPGGVVTTVAGNYQQGLSDGDIDGQGTSASFSSVVSMTIDNHQNFFVSDFVTEIHRIDQQGYVTTFLAINTGDADGPIPATGAIRAIFAMIVDASGNFYVTDPLNHKVRKISWQ